MSNRTIGETLTWVGTVVGGAWLSMWVARCMTETMARAVAGEPVRGLVEEALVEHQADDTVMVHAFEEALEDEEAEETANAR